MRLLKPLFVVLSLFLFASAAHAQARLIVENRSAREMTVKIMRTNGVESWLHATTSIGPFADHTIYFSETGTYFLKTMAVASGRSPLFQKGEPFNVYKGRDGHTVMRITFSIVEPAVPPVLDGEEISRQ